MQTSILRASSLVLTLGWVAGPALPADEKSVSPEKQTMEMLRSIAGALLSRQIDEQSGGNALDTPARAALRRGDPPNLVRMPLLADRLSHRAVVELLQPRPDIIYLQDIPEFDAWGERIDVFYDQDHLFAERVVTVRSSGANRKFEARAYEIGAFPPGAETDDIVIADRRFVRWPAGMPEAELVVERKP